MSLPRVSALRAEEAPPPRWLPSHVQVSVGQARGLRLKGGPGDAFAVLQLGRQKHRTAVATRGPRWDEECALELPPAAPQELDAPALLLTLTVWQRALVGLDRFLGRALVPLGPLLQAGRSHPDQWHRLHSKPGKKEKERGEIQLSIHFTRHSLTASMFDLSIKDKPRSPFGKLRDKMKGRRQYDLESASAIVPSSSGALEEDLGLGGKKARGGSGGGFFFKNKLRKSSLTQSTTSLGSDSTVSSASSVAGLAALEVVGAAPSPSRHGSLPTERSVRDFLPSPKLTHKRAFSDEVSQINTLPESRSVQSLKSQNEPTSRSSLCINGSHIYCEEPSPRPAVGPSSAAAPLSRPKKPAESFGMVPPVPESELPPWSGSSISFQRAPQKDPPRFIPSPPILAAQEEDKLSVKTLALSKHRSRVKMDEGARAEGRPVQIATPMVFSAEAGRGRPPEESQKEEKRAKSGFFRRGSTKEDAGKSCVAESAGHVAVAGGPEGEKSGSWFSMKDAQDPSQRPSSPSGLLAATEATKEATCVCEDRGPPAFLRVGTLPPESAPQSVSAFEPAAAASPPQEWGDPFEAFATSRLRPEAPRETLLHTDAGPDPPEDTSPPQISAGLPLQWPSEAEGSPGVAPEETLVGGGSLAQEPWGTCVESRPGHPPLLGAGFPSRAHEEDVISGASLNWKEPPLAAVEAEAASPWGEAQRVSTAGAPATLSGSELPLSLALESNTSLSGSLEKSPLSPPTGSTWQRPTALPLGNSLTSEAEAGEEASAGTCCWAAARQEQTDLQMPPAPGPQPAPGKGQIPEEANQLGSSAEWGRGVPSGSWEQSGEGRQETEAAPAKPPRTFTSLSLEEEANEALWGAQARCESQEGPGVAADGQGPLVRDGSAPQVIGAGGGSVGCGPEGLLLPAADEGPARAPVLMRQAGSLGGSVQGANEGAGGAELLEACPGQPGLTGGGGEPCSELSSGLRPQLVAGEGAPRSPGMPREPEPRPSVLFWTALEEQLLQSWEGASPEQPRGLGEGTSDAGPSLEQRDGDALASPEVDHPGSHSSQALLALSAFPQVLAGGLLRQGPQGSSASDSELSSSWSDDRVVDFKKADFWQVGRGGEGSAPSNPFVSRVSPQNNPFVERPPDVPPAPQVSPAEGPRSFGDLHAEAAPQGLLPATLPRDQPAAPFLHGNQPLASSTPSLEAATSSSEFNFPSPIVHPASGEGSAARGLLAAPLSLSLPSPITDAAASSVSLVETQPADEAPAQRTTSPHPVKPISTSRPVEKQRRSSLPLGQEKLKPKPTSGKDSITPVLPLEKTDLKRDPSLPDLAAKYYHLTHDELIQLLLKREAELSKKQEHVRELENYIDRLLVRIMEQSPTLLQIPLGGGAKAAK